MDYKQPHSESKPIPESKTIPEAETISEYDELADGTKSNSAPKVESPWVETIKTIGLSVVLAFGIRTFVAEARYIPSGSMLPTLQIDDRLIIDKITYRFSNPVRGDIVVFNPTPQLEKEKDSSGNYFKEAFIKRVIGLPGDRVDVKAGKVYINGKVLSEPYLDEPPAKDWSTTDPYTTDSEGQHYRLPWPADGVVPKGQYLVLGDNRNNSYDSHYWGFVPKDKIVGKASVRFWPINRAGGIDPQPDYR
jgi:signal peptidase I